MLLLWLIGVSGLGRPGIAEHNGSTKRQRFSYSANSLSIFHGVDLFVDLFFVSLPLE